MLVLEIVSSAEVNQHRPHPPLHLHFHSPGGPVVPYFVPPHLGLAVFRRRLLLPPPLSVPVPVPVAVDSVDPVDSVDHDSYCY